MGNKLHPSLQDDDSEDGEPLKCSCGNVLMDDADFCRKCGKPRSEIVAEKEASRNSAKVEALRLTATGGEANGGKLSGIAEETPAELRKQNEAPPAIENEVEEITLRQSLPEAPDHDAIALMKPGVQYTDAKVDDIQDLPGDFPS